MNAFNNVILNILGELGGSASVPMADLPEPRVSHCMAKISDNQIVLIGGGRKGEKFSNMFIYDIDADSWTDGNAEMSIARSERLY